MQTVTYKAGDTIISEGDEGDTAFLIVKGSAEVSVGEGGKAKVLGTLGEGEVFGEMCLIEPGPRSATVTAKTDIECVSTSYDEFMTSMQENPERALAFLKTLVRRLREMNEQVAKMSPGKRGLRDFFRDWQKPLDPIDPRTDPLDYPPVYWMTLL